ncbi:MAG: CARDB domain-containing protein [Myxococcota bacterium]
MSNIDDGTGDSGSDTSAGSQVGDATEAADEASGTGSGSGADSESGSECPAEPECAIGDPSTCEEGVSVACVEDAEGCPRVETTDCPTGECDGDVCAGASGGCGDGVVDDGEDCDDANRDAGDGCSGTCTVEDGWTCMGEPSNCGAPDLTVRITGVEEVGNSLQVSYTVRNVGSGPSGPYRLDLWPQRPDNDWSAPPSFGESGTVTLVDQPSLLPGESDSGQESFMGIANNATGAAFAVVDSGETIFELDENNNFSLGSGWSRNGGVNARSFTLTGEPVTLMPGQAVTSNIDITYNELSFITYIIGVNATHPDVSGIELSVMSPSSASRVLVDGGLAGENLQSTTFSDFGGAGPIVSGFAPYSGQFDAAEDWVGGPSADGTWQLQITNNSDEPGRLNEWNVTVWEIFPQ